MSHKVRNVQEFMQGREVWTASHPDLPGCHAIGRTHDEALSNLAEACVEWLARAKTRGVTVPPEPADLWWDVVFSDP